MSRRLYVMDHLAAFAGIWGDDVDLDAGRIIVRWQITDKSHRKARVGEDRPVDLDADSVKALAYRASPAERS